MQRKEDWPSNLPTVASLFGPVKSQIDLMITRYAEGKLAGHKYDVVTSLFEDTIHILVHKNERISRVLECQLYPQPGGVTYQDGLVAGLTPRGLLGSQSEDISGHLYTELIGSMILNQNADEHRSLIMCLGNIGPSNNETIEPFHKEEILFVLELVKKTYTSWI